MDSRQTARVPVSVWSAAALGMIGILLVAASLYNHFLLTVEQREMEAMRRPFDFETERLEKIGTHGLIVVGTSLSQYGFPFDGVFMSLAGKKGLAVNFVRFSRNGLIGRNFLTRQNYRALMPEILKYRPRWVFLQAEPFFLDFVKRDKKLDRRSLVRKWVETLHLHLHYLFGLAKSVVQSFFSESARHLIDTHPLPVTKARQDDSNINLDIVAHIEMSTASEGMIAIYQPVFPDYIENFIVQAKKSGTVVVLLEMNRSQVGNDYFGRSFRSQLTNTLEQVSKRYQIPYWRFHGDLPLDYYIDRAHLNRKGRAVFSEWFLARFAREYGHDGL